MVISITPRGAWSTGKRAKVQVTFMTKEKGKKEAIANVTEAQRKQR